MEVMTTTNAAVTTPAAAPTKIPEADIEIPTRIQSNKPAPFANGILKRLHPHSPLPLHHHVSATNTSSLMVAYKECLKNHAASLGGHALDGCGEFMPSPISIPTDPTSLKCAACGCHRNFHRRDPEEQASPTTAVIEYRPHHRHHPPPPLPLPQSVQPSAPQPPRSPGSHSPPPISSSYYPSAPHMLLALSAGAAGLSGPTPAPPQPPPPLDIGGTPSPILQVTPMASITPTNPNGRKRFRTKFSQGQKEKMCQFAERVGWKMQKRDEELVSEFCSEIGVDRGVLKVWMHNNKNTLGKIRDANGNIINNNHSPLDNNNHSPLDNNNNINMNHENLFHHNNNGSSAHVATNGSSSSS